MLPFNAMRLRAAAGGPPPASTWDPGNMGTNFSLSGSNLVATSSGGGSGSVFGTNGRASGSGVFQFEVLIGGSNDRMRVGIAKTGANLNQPPGSDMFAWAYVGFGGTYTSNGFVGYGVTFAAGAVIGVKWDAAAGELTFYKNGVSQGLAFSGLSGTFYPIFGIDTTHVVVGTLSTASFAHPIGGATAWG